MRGSHEPRITRIARMTRATDYTDSLRSRLAPAGLSDVAEKLDAGVRLDLEDGVRLFDSPDLLALGWLANRDRERRHAARTYYNYNIRIEATNVCVASCLFCAFARLKPGDADAYTMSLEEVWGKLRSRARSGADRGSRRQRPAPGSAVRVLHGDAARPEAHPAVDPLEVFHRGRDRLLRGPLRDDATSRCCAS